MMTRQARLSAAIMGFDTHMILEAVPAPHSNDRTVTRASNQTSRHYAGALARNRKIWRKIHSASIGPGSRKYSAALGARAPCATASDAL